MSEHPTEAPFWLRMTPALQQRLPILFAQPRVVWLTLAYPAAPNQKLYRVSYGGPRWHRSFAEPQQREWEDWLLAAIPEKSMHSLQFMTYHWQVRFEATGRVRLRIWVQRRIEAAGHPLESNRNFQRYSFTALLGDWRLPEPGATVVSR